MITTIEHMKKILLSITLLAISAAFSWIPSALNLQNEVEPGMLANSVALITGILAIAAIAIFFNSTKNRLKEYGISGWYSYVSGITFCGYGCC